jgi:hypothetical protein
MANISLKLNRNYRVAEESVAKIGQLISQFSKIRNVAWAQKSIFLSF